MDKAKAIFEIADLPTNGKWTPNETSDCRVQTFKASTILFSIASKWFEERLNIKSCNFKIVETIKWHGLHPRNTSLWRIVFKLDEFVIAINLKWRITQIYTYIYLLHLLNGLQLHVIYVLVMCDLWKLFSMSYFVITRKRHDVKFSQRRLSWMKG